MKTLVIALGGNALLQRGEVLSAENQYRSIAQLAPTISQLAKQYRIAIVHGNGPQVGLLALQNLAYSDVPPYPLDVLGAESQGMIGYMLAQELARYSPKPVSALLTRVLVDKNDPAFQQPSKFIGPVYSPEQKEEIETRYGWQVKADGKYVRRVVPSPDPKEIMDCEAIKLLLDQQHVVICCGGGGIPMVECAEGYQGIEAVIDKDLAAARLAEELNAEHLIILTDADAVYRDWGTPQQAAIRSATPEEIAPMAVNDGSMGPKLMAVSRFVQRSGHHASIGALKDIEQVLIGEAGTLIHP